MKKLSNYIPYILAAVLFFTGRWTSPKPDKELMHRYELERKYHLEEINKKSKEISHLSKQWFTLRQYMRDDSIKYANDLQANKEAYLKLKKKYNEINLSRASVSELDSLISALYR